MRALRLLLLLVPVALGGCVVAAVPARPYGHHGGYHGGYYGPPPVVVRPAPRWYGPRYHHRHGWRGHPGWHGH